MVEDFLLLLLLLLAGVDMMIVALLPALLLPLLLAVRNPNALPISRRDAAVSSLAVRLVTVIAPTSSTPMGMVGWLALWGARNAAERKIDNHIRLSVAITQIFTAHNSKSGQKRQATSGHQAHGDIPSRPFARLVAPRKLRKDTTR